jgi:hypothetical protein
MRFLTYLVGLLLLSALLPQNSVANNSKTETIYFIGGKIVDGDGKAGCSVRVCAFEQDFDPKKPNVEIPCALSDNEGRFSIQVKKPGAYKLFYDAAEQGYWGQYQPFFRHPQTAIPEVTVNTTTIRGPVTILLPQKNGLLSGKTIDAKTGLPVEDVEFVLCLANQPDICRVTSAKAADGVYTIPAPHLPFTLRVKSNGFNDWLGMSGYERSPMQVAAGTTTQLDVLLTRPASTVNATLVESEKQPGFNLPAPVQKSPADGAVFNRYPRSTELEWLPVEGAVSYSVEVDYCKGGRQAQVCVNPQPLVITTNPPMQGITATTYQFQFVGAQPGRWRVWAVDKDGREGFKSPWQTFIYRQ